MEGNIYLVTNKIEFRLIRGQGIGINRRICRRNARYEEWSQYFRPMNQSSSKKIL